MALLEAVDICKTYTDTAQPVEVLRGLDFSVEPGEVACIFGASGSGKSTLLHIVGGLDRPTRGRVTAAGHELAALDQEGMARFRNREVGFVFQFYHLLPEFTALENVMLPALIAGHDRSRARDMAEQSLVSVGLSQRLGHRPAMLSGGEQQRAAIARAAVLRPRIILADEPTGNLDLETGRTVWRFMLELARKGNSALVAVTHNRDLIDDTMTAYELHQGALQRLGR